MMPQTTETVIDANDMQQNHHHPEVGIIFGYSFQQNVHGAAATVKKPLLLHIHTLH